MGNRLAGRLKKLEDKMMINAPGTLIVIQRYGESKRQAIQRAKREYGQVKGYDLIFIINYSNPKEKKDEKQTQKRQGET